MIYIPEILPLPGVTIAITAMSIGKILGYLILFIGYYSPMIMLLIVVLVSSHFHY